MGTCFNPGNESYNKDKNSQLYVDKSGLLDFLNCDKILLVGVSYDVEVENVR